MVNILKILRVYPHYSGWEINFLWNPSHNALNIFIYWYISRAQNVCKFIYIYIFKRTSLDILYKWNVNFLSSTGHLSASDNVIYTPRYKSWQVITVISALNQSRNIKHRNCEGLISSIIIKSFLSLGTEQNMLGLPVTLLMVAVLYCRVAEGSKEVMFLF